MVKKQVPQFLLAGGMRVVVTQPRRLAATSVAVRVAEELGEQLGDVVGCAVRGDVKMSTRTALLFCTVGVRLDRFCP